MLGSPRSTTRALMSSLRRPGLRKNSPDLLNDGPSVSQRIVERDNFESGIVNTLNQLVLVYPKPCLGRIRSRYLPLQVGIVAGFESLVDADHRVSGIADCLDQSFNRVIGCTPDDNSDIVWFFIRESRVDGGDQVGDERRWVQSGVEFLDVGDP